MFIIFGNGGPYIWHACGLTMAGEVFNYFKCSVPLGARLTDTE